MEREVECRVHPSAMAAVRAGPASDGTVVVCHPLWIEGPRRDVLVVNELSEMAAGAAAAEGCDVPRFTLSLTRLPPEPLHVARAARAVRQVGSDGHPIEVELIRDESGRFAVRAWRGREAVRARVRVLEASGACLASGEHDGRADGVPRGGQNRVLPRTGRTMSAASLERLAWTRVAIVGCGRAGGLVADALVAQGFRAFALIDRDTLEAGNMDGSTLVVPGDVGRAKVVALGDAIAKRRPDAEITRVVSPVEDPDAMSAMAEAHVVVTCVDRAEARWVVNAAARTFAQLHVDMGSGRDPEGRWVSDVRMLPVGDGCLRCMGGSEARQSSERPTHVVNATGAARVAHDIVRWVSGAATARRWDRMVFDADWDLRAERPPVPTDGCDCTGAGRGSWL